MRFRSRRNRFLDFPTVPRHDVDDIVLSWWTGDLFVLYFRRPGIGDGDGGNLGTVQHVGHNTTAFVFRGYHGPVSCDFEILLETLEKEMLWSHHGSSATHFHPSDD